MLRIKGKAHICSTKQDIIMVTYPCGQ